MGTLESQSCNKAGMAQKAYEFFTETVLLERTVGAGEMTRQDALEMMTVALEGRWEQRRKTYISADACKNAEDLLEIFLR